MLKRVFIMRGVPGSGKSTAAKWLADPSGIYESWIEDSVTYYGSKGEEIYIHSAIHSTDEYFMVGGEYKFNASKIGINHNKNYKAFRDSIDSELPVVIVDNTNTTRSEWSKYEEYAKSSGYWVSYHVMPHPSLDEASERNQHNVPKDVINKMIKRFE